MLHMTRPALSHAREGIHRRDHSRPVLGRRFRIGAAALAVLLGVAGPQFADKAHAGTFTGENGTLAFASEGPNGADIFTVSPNGAHLRRVIKSPTGKLSAYSDWSPDGRTLAFDSNRSGKVQIYVRSSDGRVQRLTNNSSRAAHPAWSPDGRHLVFEGDRSGTKQVYVMNRDGTHVRQVTHFAPGAEEPSYSPTGEWITFLSGPVAHTSLFVVRPDGTGLRRITPRSMNAGHPSWSPDGERIVFNTNIEKTNGRIWTVTPRGALRQITTGRSGQEDFEPAYSPDGRFIAFTRYVADPKKADIWVMRADGSGAHDITPTSSGFDTAATWAPAVD
jgi:TolB protein